MFLLMLLGETVLYETAQGEAILGEVVLGKTESPEFF